MWNNTDFHKIVEEGRQMKAMSQNAEAGHEKATPSAVTTEDMTFIANWMLT